MKFKTREEWLMALVAKLLPRYQAVAGGTPPKVRVSVGQTSNKKAIGECWHAEASADRTREIFIRPDQHDPVEVADTLAHELVHAFMPPDAKHGPKFKRFGLVVGLVGKPSEMGAGPELKAELTVMCKELGAFPHAKLTMLRLVKKQTTRLKKVLCAETGYTVRVTRQWLDMFGTPICPCCESPMEESE